jgi:hypothetical protein
VRARLDAEKVRSFGFAERSSHDRRVDRGMLADLCDRCVAGAFRIREAVAALPVDTVVLDGEAILLRPDNTSDFDGLRSRQGQAEAILVAYDIIDDSRPRGRGDISRSPGPHLQAGVPFPQLSIPTFSRTP